MVNELDFDLDHPLKDTYDHSDVCDVVHALVEAVKRRDQKIKDLEMTHEVDIANAVWVEREACKAVASEWSSDVRINGTSRVTASKIAMAISERN